MAFVNLSVIAAGSLFVAVPILLHLLMRARPKHRVFPALRFLQERRIVNQRQMQLRNWLLLVLRCLAVALLAAALARPSVASSIAGHWTRAIVLLLILPLLLIALAASVVGRKGRLVVGPLAACSLVAALATIFFGYRALTASADQVVGDAAAPVAAVLVFDTSHRMDYRHRNKSRLEEARQTATWLLQQLPDESEVSIIDSAATQPVAAIDIAAAVNMIDSLEITNVPMPLTQLIGAALTSVQDRPDKRKEIYVFSDLTLASWQAGSSESLRELLQKSPDILFYVFDVGVQQPRNFALEELELSAQSLPGGRALTLRTDLSHIGPGGGCAVEVNLEQQSDDRPVIVDGQILLPESTQRDRAQTTLTADGSQRIEFELRGLEKGTHHGFLQLDAGDGLLVDDKRYFTVEVRGSWPALILTGDGAEPRYLANALSPYILRETGQAAFDCRVIGIQELANYSVNDYAVVALLDPSPLTEAIWQGLAQYVREGGGLAIFLGRNADPVDTFNLQAESVLPGKLHLRWRAGGDEQFYISPRNLAHPILAAFREKDTITPWDSHPVFIHWGLKDMKPGASVVTTFSNDQPALWESTLGQGRILTMTTPISDTRYPTDGREPWNLLPTGEDWSFFVLANELFLYLAGAAEASLNYEVGQAAAIRLQNEVSSTDRRYQLFTPRGDWQEVATTDTQATVRFTETPGIYRLKPAVPGQPVLGFSVNLPRGATRLQRVDDTTLAEILGQDRYLLARDRDELDRGIGQARAGSEFYPFLLVLLAAMLGLEHLMSNRFYGNR